ncbi:purine-cytosine permease family protein [Actinokineospora bangkokensis]|uniref:Cytosine permease n=1 Tax=Actinokineospora bangkokensis TaxID=1193682 RepID=A0A1Q9LIQ3_9PSEU|nr:cytosine permease [Actinokineospora bangkokensis]OLR91874.1 cytosine permease [Actinokineospora bangkokensis]
MGAGAEVFGGRMPSGEGDLGVETHGISPIPAGNRFGRPWRLFGVWFAPNLTMAAIFTGTLGAVLGLDFRTGLAAIAVGTLIGALPVAYLSTWGPRTGSAQLPVARLPFARGVVLPGAVQWLSTIMWDALTALFGGDALAELSGMPFWLSVGIVLVLQCLLGVFGYAVIHRVQTVVTAVGVVGFALFAIKAVPGHPLPAGGELHGGALAGAVVLFTTISLSLAVSWVPYASDYSRYLPAGTPPRSVFWFTGTAIVLSCTLSQGLGLALADTLGGTTAAGVRGLVGGGAAGVVALLVILVVTVSANAMNDYSGSLALQTVGIRLRRPVSAVIATVVAYALTLWMHSGDLSAKFENVLLFVGYWVPPFLGVVLPDWVARRRGAAAAARSWPALLAFLAGFAAAVPFTNTSLYTGPVAAALDGADLAYYVGFLVSAAVYLVVRRFAGQAPSSSPAGDEDHRRLPLRPGTPPTSPS